MRVYTAGVFEILHRGHIDILTHAARLGELIVGIMTDEGVQNTTGVRPILSLEEREAQVRAFPFVANVIHYTDVDQRANYAALRPDVVVQDDDWPSSPDHTPSLNYLRDNGIRLALLPRTQSISSAEIRKRVERSRRSDEPFLHDRLRMVPISDLKRFEAHDETKVEKLVARIRAEGTFFNPISVVREMIVIDGANRFEALRRLGAKRVPCIVFDYTEIDLLANVHYISDGTTTRLSEFAREAGERVEFPQRSPADIRAAAENGRLIPNGETFHRVPYSVIRLPIPLAALTSNAPFDLAGYIDSRIANGHIRFYGGGVYVCDE